MSQKHANKGSWTHRYLVHLFIVFLTILIFWLLGFIIKDIGSWPGPDYAAVETRLVDASLVQQAEALQKQISDIERQIGELKMRQRIVEDSTNNSQRTMSQLLEIRRLSLQKDVALSAEEQKALAESEQQFLSNQREYQALNESVAELNEQLRKSSEEKRDLDSRLETERKPAQHEYESLREQHDLKMAAIKLAVLVPLLLVAVVLCLKKRNSIYVWLIYAFGIAVLSKVALVMHEYFPTRYFKYVLILAALAVVGRILVYLLRTIAFPGAEWLMKQYREAYETFFCPVCSYPIRRGPLKYTFWTRRSIKKRPFFSSTPTNEADEPYTCPMCGTRLYEECDECHSIRHSLLPSCKKCGAAKPLTSIVGLAVEESKSDKVEQLKS